MPERLIIEEEQDQFLKQQHLARYQFAADHVQGKVVLDVACGTGYGSALLKDRGAKRVVAVDVSPEAIEFATRHYRTAGLEFMVGDAHELAKCPTADLAVSFETIEHLSEPERFLASVRSRLERGGTFIVSTPIRQSGELRDEPRNPYHVTEWSVREFVDLLTAYFPKIDMGFQFNFRKMWYPGSRTIANGLAELLYPHRHRDFVQFPVCYSPPALPAIPVVPEFMIGVCTIA